MHLASLQATNFKNYEEVHLNFSPGLNLLTGKNGSGKTNLLDAVYFLCLTKSAFHSNDSHIIRHEESFFSLTGKFSLNSKNFRIHAALQKGQKKIFSCNKQAYAKSSEHIGTFPVVLITPYDTDLIREGSEERRKFFDSILSQTDAEYLAELIKYNKILKQRNAALKQFAEQRKTDHVLLSIYDDQLIPSAEKIFVKRAQLIEEFIPVFKKYYSDLSDNKEEVSLAYDSKLHIPDFRELFKQARQKDLILQRTTQGIHKDDFDFLIKGYSSKSFGSQGQQKSYIIALKLAQYEYIASKSGKKPILLLDDIFDKLDQTRIEKLLDLMREDMFGQIFITEAREDRLDDFFKIFNQEIAKFNIREGKVES